MTNILDEICRHKRKEVEILKKNVDINFLKKNLIIKNFIQCYFLIKMT